jgi:hypothetical protein
VIAEKETPFEKLLLLLLLLLLLQLSEAEREHLPRQARDEH